MGLLSCLFSQTREVRRRKERHLHPVDEMHRFYILLVSYFCSISVSIIYCYDLFSEDFEVRYRISAGDLTTISTVGLVFCYFTIPYSFIFENLGPFIIFLVCGVCALIGGLCLALVFLDRIPGNTATITVFYAFLNVSSGLIDTAYISTLFEYFPRNRGPVVCLAKVMTSLGGSVLACIQTSFFSDNIAGFIFFLMAVVVLINIWAAFSIVLPPYYMNWWRRRGKTEEQLDELIITRAYYEDKNVPFRRLIVGYVVVIALLIFSTVQAPMYSKVSVGANRAMGAICVVLTMSILLMMLPLSILGGVNEPAPPAEEARRIETRFRKEEETRLNMIAETKGGAQPREGGSDSADLSPEVEKPTADVEARTEEVALYDGVEPQEPLNEAEDEEPEVYEPSRQDPRYQGSVIDYLLSIDVWLIMLLFICYGCTGILVMYNARVISVALTGKDQRGAIFTALQGVGSSVGRIAFGLFEAYVQHQDPAHRLVIVTTVLPFSPTLSFLASLFLNVLPGSAVLFPYMLVYVEEGFFAGINALIFPCLFENNHNTLYNLSFLVQCISTVCFNRAMFGVNIDKQAAKLQIPAGESCNKAQCVRMPLIVSTCLGFVGIFVALAIHIRYSRFVKRERARQFEHFMRGARTRQQQREQGQDDTHSESERIENAPPA